MSFWTIVFNILFLAAVVAFLVFIGWLLWLVFVGRKRKGAAQSAALGEFPAAPADPGVIVVGPTAGIYVGTTPTQNWLERIQSGEGDRAKATATGYTHGVAIERKGASTIWIPREAIVEVRLTDRAAGKVMHADGILAVDWTLPAGAAVTSAVRADEKNDYPHWLVAFPGTKQQNDPEAAE